MAKNAFKDIVKGLDNQYASVLSDGVVGEGTAYHIDTGSYALNALLGGSIFSGMQSDTFVCISGEEATGKTFLAISVNANFQKQFEDGLCVYFESERAIHDKRYAESRGVDTSRFMLRQVGTVENFRSEAFQIAANYKAAENRPPMMITLDSLGNLSTDKEIKSVSENTNIRDMTRTQLIKGAFRVLRMELGILNIPILMTNHVYQKMDLYGGTEMSGGSGAKYAGDVIVNLTKAKHREAQGGPVTGIVVTATLKKSRFVRHDTKVKLLIDHTRGLDKYHGLVELAIEAGVWKKLSRQIELEDGTKKFEKAINGDPERYFTQDVLQKIDEYVRRTFPYGDKEDKTEE